MCFTLQRYKFESNSQPVVAVRGRWRGCALPCKDTNLKAIHIGKWVLLLAEGDLDDVVDGCGNGWELDGDATGRGGVAELGFIAEVAHLLDLLSAQWQIEGIVLEVENVYIDGVAALSGHAPIVGWNDATTGAVDALAVHPHPVTQGMEAFNSFDRQAAIGAGADVDEQVTVAAGSLDERANDVVAALVVLVGDAVTPCVVHGHAGLERQLADAVLARVAGGVLARDIMLKDLDILAGKGHLVVVVTDEAGGLQTMNEGILLVELPVKGHRVGIMLPLAVKPDGTHGP